MQCEHTEYSQLCEPVVISLVTVESLFYLGLLL